MAETAARPRVIVHSRILRTVLSILHVGGIVFAYGAMAFVAYSLKPFFADIPRDTLNSILGIFLPLVWAFLPLAIATGILKIFELLPTVKQMGPALGSLYGKIVLTKMLVGSIFLTNAFLITNTAAGKLALTEWLSLLLYVQLALGVFMIGFGVTLRNTR